DCFCCGRMPLLLPRPAASCRRRRWRNSVDGGDNLRGVPDSPQAALRGVARDGNVHIGEEAQGRLRCRAISCGTRGGAKVSIPQGTRGFCRRDELQKLKRTQPSPFSRARVAQPGRPFRPASTRLKTGNSFRNENCWALSQVQIKLKC